jgi:hypothetical protein
MFINLINNLFLLISLINFFSNFKIKFILLILIYIYYFNILIGVIKF